jgi:two-component system NtrC family response regulator
LARFLIIDDDEMMCRMLSQAMEREGHHVKTAFTLGAGVKEAHSGALGLDGLPRIREAVSVPEVIIITGAGDPDGAELAIKSGAWDYIQKPASVKQMTLPLVRALQYRDEKKAEKPRVALKREGIVGSSLEMEKCLDVIAQAANSTGNVLISGETGTGKELFAGAIHANSSRADKSFVIVDFASLPETLVESVLFGHRKSAFTGAGRAHEGLVQQADGGTLFLDEIGELPLSLQKAFLRVLQEHRFRPVGTDRSYFTCLLWVAKPCNFLIGKRSFFPGGGVFCEDLKRGAGVIRSPIKGRVQPPDNRKMGP